MRIASGTSSRPWQVPCSITCSTTWLAGGFIQTGLDQGCLEQRAGIGQLQILPIIIDMADISQGKDRLAAIAFAAGHGGNRPGGRNRGLGGIADAVLPDALHSLLPIHFRTTPIPLYKAQSRLAAATA